MTPLFYHRQFNRIGRQNISDLTNFPALITGGEIMIVSVQSVGNKEGT